MCKLKESRSEPLPLECHGPTSRCQTVAALYLAVVPLFVMPAMVGVVRFSSGLIGHQAGSPGHRGFPQPPSVLPLLLVSRLQRLVLRFLVAGWRRSNTLLWAGAAG